MSLTKTTTVTKEMQTNVDISAVRKLIEKQQEDNANSPRRMIIGIQGDAKTGKSGLTMDTEKLTYYLDCDNGAVPTWKANHDSTDRVVIYNPAISDDEGNFLPYQTQGNIRSFIAMVKQEIESGKEVLFVWDGVDTWLDYCTLYMTGMENARMRPMKTDQQQLWYQRNQPFTEVLKEAKQLLCDQIYITHTKPAFRDEGPQPIWARWDSHLWGVINTKQRVTAKGIEYVANVVSSKYHPELVGKTNTFLTVGRDGVVTWVGLDYLKEGRI